MKKIVSLLLIVLVLSLVSCSRHVVSESEWEKAFSLESFSKVTFVMTIEKNGKENCERITIKADEGKYFYLVEKIYDENKGFEEENLNYYCTDSEGVSWEYYKSSSDGEWNKRLSDNHALNIFIDMSQTFESVYSLFKYDEENKVYIIEDDAQYTISFIDGKLSQIKEVEFRGDYSNIYTYVVTEYGKTKVELPVLGQD